MIIVRARPWNWDTGYRLEFPYLAFTDTPTTDGRTICGLITGKIDATKRTLPVPIMIQDDRLAGHEGSVQFGALLIEVRYDGEGFSGTGWSTSNPLSDDEDWWPEVDLDIGGSVASHAENELTMETWCLAGVTLGKNPCWPHLPPVEVTPWEGWPS